MRTYILISFISSLLLAGAMTRSDCQAGTYEQCLMSKGFFWLYWLGLFLFILLLVAAIGRAVKELRDKEDQE